MKALLRKDFYVLWSSMKVLLLLIVVFSLIPSGFQNTFAVLYASMLPYSALAYDERSHWDQMALCMPYSARDIVRSKYVLGWLSACGAFLIAALAQVILGAVSKPSTPLSVLFLSFCSACIVIAITLPFMFRFGVEKARLTMFLIIALVCGGASALSAVLSISAVFGGGLSALSLPLGLIAALLANLISMHLSEKWYERRK